MTCGDVMFIVSTSPQPGSINIVENEKWKESQEWTGVEKGEEGIKGFKLY